MFCYGFADGYVCMYIDRWIDRYPALLCTALHKISLVRFGNLSENFSIFAVQYLIWVPGLVRNTLRAVVGGGVRIGGG